MVDGKSLLDSLLSGVARNEQGPAGGGKVGDVVGGMLGQLTQGAGGIAGKAKEVLSNATSGVKEGAQAINDATGAGGKIDDLLKQLTGGSSSGDLVNQARDLIQNNKVAAGTLAGVLGGLMLGTRSGRGLSWDAAKIGGLVLIGGLAYKAYKNHQQGKPLSGGDAGLPGEAPAGSGFEPRAQSNDNALLYVQAMIAAATADGTVDNEERQRIAGHLAQAGFRTEGTDYLTQAFNNPASIDDLARQAGSPEVRAQVYTAARVAIDPDTPAEQTFLAALAGKLGIAAELKANIDSAVAAVKA